VNRALGLHLPVGPDRTTIAGVCIALAFGIPSAGQMLVAEDGTRLQVVESSPRRVRRVRILRAETPDRPTNEPTRPTPA
jgi:putative hemolysin